MWKSGTNDRMEAGMCEGKNHRNEKRGNWKQRGTNGCETEGRDKERREVMSIKWKHGRNEGGIVEGE